ncbi:MAG TPA: GIY-YIG nuclease family protein [Candidatus Bathyarchaeia archaeon]|nr:GIY-YIG nuclease family protein [Candidatus Bathyarchaeia archaeon]
MEWEKLTVRSASLAEEHLNFVQATPNQIPTQPGAYLIHDDTSNQIIYAGRTRNLRTRLLQQHKRGNVEGSQFRKALGQNLNLNDEAITHNTPTIALEAAQGKGFEFLYPYVRLSLLSAGTVLAIVCLWQRRKSSNHS